MDKQSLIGAWQTNNRMNILLINNTTDTGMNTTLSKKGGRTVYQQWIHILSVRLQWLETCASDLAAGLVTLRKEDPYNRKKLLEGMASTSKAIELLFEKSWDNEGKLKGFSRGLFSFFAYLVAHDAHHRGNILLTLKQSGEKIPDTLKWGLWEWNK